MKNCYHFLLIILCCFFTFCQSPWETSSKADLIIINATIINVTGGETIKSAYLKIKSDSIAEIGHMAEFDDANGDSILDVKNAYLLPSFWDNHVHFRGGSDLIEENKSLLAMFLDFGITTVRDAGGDITPSVLSWRHETQKNPQFGPTIFSSGPKLDGKKPAWPGSLPIENQLDVKLALDSLEKLKVDFVKTYDGSLTAENYYQIISEAEKRNLAVTGHMPLSANLEKAVLIGLDGSEHLYYYLKSCSKLTESLPDSLFNYQMFSRVLEEYSPALASKAAKLLATNDVYVTPTLFIGKTLAGLTEQNHQEDSLLVRIGKGIVDTYQGRIESAKIAKKNGNSMRSQMDQLTDSIIPLLHQEGVRLLAGSDCGPYNSFVYPGESLWGELFMLKEKGLSNAEVLKTSFVNGPAFFSLDEKYGSITEGKFADINIFEKSPVENLDNIRTLKIVIHKGEIVRKLN